MCVQWKFRAREPLRQEFLRMWDHLSLLVDRNDAVLLKRAFSSLRQMLMSVWWRGTYHHTEQALINRMFQVTCIVRHAQFSNRLDITMGPMCFSSFSLSFFLLCFLSFFLSFVFSLSLSLFLSLCLSVSLSLTHLCVRRLL
jgi:hypothetical protein